MFWTNYHSHSSYCDGAESIEVFIRKAVEMGMHAYGISSHGPVPFDLEWTVNGENIGHYLADIQRLKTEWQNHIDIYAGLEIDFVPGLSWWDQIGPQYRELDYVIGSVHLVDSFDDGQPFEVDGDREVFQEGLKQIFKGDVRAMITRYYELVRWMVMLENPNIIGHLDKIKIQNIGGQYFSETEAWYRYEIEKTLKVIANMGAIVEVNTRGLYSGKTLDLYPSQWILERILSLGIPITLSSDAHRPEEITAGFGFASQILQNIGFNKLTILRDGKWRQVSFNEDGLDVHWRPGGESQSA